MHNSIAGLIALEQGSQIAKKTNEKITVYDFHAEPTRLEQIDVESGKRLQP